MGCCLCPDIEVYVSTIPKSFFCFFRFLTEQILLQPEKYIVLHSSVAQKAVLFCGNAKKAISVSQEVGSD